MTRLAFRIGGALAVCLVSVPAVASIMVLGGSPGRACYDHARARNASWVAVKSCDDALATGAMSQHDVVATHVNRGILKLYGQKYDDAIADFDRAIALDPSEPETYLNKGSTYLRMGGSTSDAINLFDEALRRETRRPELAYYGRAIAHETAGNVQAAYNDYRRAQRAAPKWDEPQRELTRFKVVRTSGSL